jgi:hypothetical protein
MEPIRMEFPFLLHIGFVDNQGQLHREGVMRRATAGDEIAALSDIRVRNNSAFLPLIVLSSVIVRLGSHEALSVLDIQNLYLPDFNYLQSFYNEVNNIVEESATSALAGDMGSFPGNVEALSPRTSSIKR